MRLWLFSALAQLKQDLRTLKQSWTTLLTKLIFFDWISIFFLFSKHLSQLKIYNYLYVIINSLNEKT